MWLMLSTQWTLSQYTCITLLYVTTPCVSHVWSMWDPAINKGAWVETNSVHSWASTRPSLPSTLFQSAKSLSWLSLVLELLYYSNQVAHTYCNQGWRLAWSAVSIRRNRLVFLTRNGQPRSASLPLTKAGQADPPTHAHDPAAYNIWWKRWDT